MVKKQQLAGLVASLFSSGGSSSRKEVLPCPSTSSSSSSSWQWPSCGQPRTLSFRQEHQKQQQHFHGHQTTMEQAYKTMNSAHTCLCSETSDDGDPVDASSESEAEAVVISALRSDRLFFLESSSCFIIEQQAASYKEANNTKAQLAFGGATAVSVESENPYRDFRESMEAVVMSQQQGGGGVKDWRWLEEMLGWYLRANGKSTHGVIVGAFVDLLVSLSDTPLASSSSSDDDNCSYSDRSSRHCSTI